MLRFCALFALSTSFDFASGSFVLPRPPQVQTSVDENAVKSATIWLETRGASGKTCLECHGSAKPNEFNRRSVGKKLNALSVPVNTCFNDKERMGDTKTLDNQSPEILALRQWLAKTYNLQNLLQ